ncbi:MAG: hypothetical protein ACR2IK_01615 [Chloroflexota bacterium]
MSPLKSNRLAWSVAAASLALWASTAPVTWGQVATGANSFFAQTASDPAATNTTTTDIQAGDTTITTNDGGVQSAPCPTPPPTPTQVTPPTPVTPAAAAGQPGTFHICGPDPTVAPAIERLIGGRGFTATLQSRGDGCADLTVRPNSEPASGSSSSSLSVSLGSGRNLSIHIVSTQGATHATVDAG